jgi:hypothetical protein
VVIVLWKLVIMGAWKCSDMEKKKNNDLLAITNQYVKYKDLDL